MGLLRQSSLEKGKLMPAEMITICEVGTRDGFQIEPEFILTELKIEAVNRLSAVCGRDSTP